MYRLKGVSHQQEHQKNVDCRGAMGQQTVFVGVSYQQGQQRDLEVLGSAEGLCRDLTSTGATEGLRGAGGIKQSL